jgi:hypothetical protein
VSRNASTQLGLDVYGVEDQEDASSDVRPTTPDTADRRERPENIRELEADCCWHCHNPVSMMHILDCQSCGYTVKSPAVQDQPTCPECWGQMECQRYTRRWYRDDETFRKRCYHPKTGEQKRVETLWEEGFK